MSDSDKFGFILILVKMNKEEKESIIEIIDEDIVKHHRMITYLTEVKDRSGIETHIKALAGAIIVLEDLNSNLETAKSYIKDL